jgi:hypothetical protein
MKKYNTDIPGWMNERELKILSTLAGYVPENGSILEIGCFLGSSTTALYRGKHSSVSLDVVDCFQGLGAKPLLLKPFEELFFYLGDPDIYYKARDIAVKEGWQQAFKFCVGEEIYNNINLFPTTSNEFVKNKTYNLTFIDADHTLQSVLQDIKKFDSDTELLIGDDFHNWYNGVAVALNQTRNTRTLIVFEGTKLWAFVPKSGYWRDVFKNNNMLFLN